MRLFCIVIVCKKQVKRFRWYEAQTRRFQDASYKECKKDGKNKETDCPQKECHCETEIRCAGNGCNKTLTAGFKKTRDEQKIFFGLDLHKKFLQVAAVDQKGNLLMNKRVENDFGIIEQEFSAFPKNAKYVLESSSVWYGIYQKLVGDLGLDVILSNPYLTRLIAKSKKKTDQFDAHSNVVKNSDSFFLAIGNNFLENLSKSLI